MSVHIARGYIQTCLHIMLILITINISWMKHTYDIWTKPDNSLKSILLMEGQTLSMLTMCKRQSSPQAKPTLSFKWKWYGRHLLTAATIKWPYLTPKQKQARKANAQMTHHLNTINRHPLHNQPSQKLKLFQTVMLNEVQGYSRMERAVEFTGNHKHIRLTSLHGHSVFIEDWLRPSTIRREGCWFHFPALIKLYWPCFISGRHNQPSWHVSKFSPAQQHGHDPWLFQKRVFSVYSPWPSLNMHASHHSWLQRSWHSYLWQVNARCSSHPACIISELAFDHLCSSYTVTYTNIPLI